MTTNAARPWVIMALIFVLGGITGSLLTIGLGPHFAHGPGPQEIRKHWMHHLVWRLQLTTDQQARIEPILTNAESQIQQAHHDDVANISRIMQEADGSIKPLLNPDQQAQLAQMEIERERMFNGHMHGPGHPHSPDEGKEGDGPPGGPPTQGTPPPG